MSNPIIANFTSFETNYGIGADAFNGTQPSFDPNQNSGPSTPPVGMGFVGDQIIAGQLWNEIVTMNLATTTLTQKTYFKEYAKQITPAAGGRDGSDYYLALTDLITATKAVVTFTFSNPSTTIAFNNQTTTCSAAADGVNWSSVCTIEPASSKNNSTINTNIPSGNFGVFKLSYSAQLYL